MKTIRVVAAVIADNLEQPIKIFATERGYGEFKGQWEFPGGKVEKGENPEAALRREIRAKLEPDIAVGQYLGTVEYDYPTFHLSMACYLCQVNAGKLTLLEHLAAQWLTREQLHTVNWLPADEIVVDWVEKVVKGSKLKESD